MAILIMVVATNVVAFSRRYLAGDRNRGLHLALVGLLSASVLVMAFALHLAIFAAAWAVSNLLLVRLMMHKLKWSAARNSGFLALKTFGLGFALLLAGFLLLANATGSMQIPLILESPGIHSSQAFVGLLLIALAAMTQSAVWPFHRWLLSSLNSPTPVSALMHAGLVNGGGFVLVRFAPAFVQFPVLLHFLFLMGLASALIGTFWKLLQGDIKRMLACSTMGQMGFMLMQCGMGLFASAVSHLCWHGLFKAFSFLNAGSAIRDTRCDLNSASVTIPNFLLAGLAGVSGSLTFVVTSGIEFSLNHTGCLMAGIAFMASSQMALGFLETKRSAKTILALPLIGLVSGGSYGLSVLGVDSILEPLQLNRPQPLDAFYLSGFLLLSLVWVSRNAPVSNHIKSLSLWKRVYVMALNGSQPHPSTMTASRNHYGI